jgi:hypothetical protein
VVSIAFIGPVANQIPEALVRFTKRFSFGAVIATFISYWFAVHGTCFLFKPLRRTGWMLTKAMIYPKIW